LTPSPHYLPERPHDPGCRMWGRARRVLARSARVYLPANVSAPAEEAAAQLADAVRAAVEGLANIAAGGQVQVSATLADAAEGGRYAVTVVFAGDAHYLDSMMFRQCQGRAGRRGFDLRGNVVFFGMPSRRAAYYLSSVLP
jgi:predicted nicotinamide N-methyase